MPRFLLALSLVLGSMSLQAQPGVAHIPLPADLSGTHNGTEYQIRVPENWNGTLLVYAHASQTTEVEVAPLTFPPSSPTLEEQLLSRGYALAGSFYQGDSDSDTGVTKTLQLTTFFNGAVGQPRRTIVWGASGGGTAALQMAESHPGTYDGAIAVAPVGAGRARDAEFALRYGVAYAAAFGWPTDWWGPLGDIRDDLMGTEDTLIAPIFQWADDTNFGQWEFVRLMMQLPPRTWWDFDESVGVWGYAIAGWKATVLRSDWERACGGPVAQNVGAVYTLTDDDKSYLYSLGVNGDALLGWMNANTNITASRSSLVCIGREGTPSGQLRRPTLTMHGMYDALLPVSNEAAYRALVDAAQRDNLLYQTYVIAHQIEDNKLSWSRRVETIAQETQLDGIYVIRTSETAEQLSAADTVRGYKSLAQVERAFRSLKSLDLLIRPIRHRTEERVPAHIFLCMLAYYVEWHLRRVWAPLLFEDEELPQERLRRDPVLPASSSESAQVKKLTYQTADGLLVQSFATLLSNLASRARVTYSLKTDKSSPTFQRVLPPTPLQAKAYELLNLLPVAGN